MGMIEWGPSYPEQPEWQGEVGGGIWDHEWARMDWMDLIDLIDLIDRMVSCEGAAQSVALGVAWGVPSERGGRGGGVPRALLWAGMWCPVGTRGGGRCGVGQGRGTGEVR